ncbi:uncharacterized protein EMH_0005470 [Eimeria mitis]|uniref:Uncharacterized protein n=1 Tax=Eimeria mitis TaxID=44415 RepID=U6KCB1_9EIME|nr:uncharacterized protein EMH_0005470 [Eimeria mitis]CDJ35594.1 hypothetical protein, conserved [Eimeria mitis]
MEDPAALLKGKEDRHSFVACREYDNLYQLELKYWSIRTLRKTVRYTGCVALAGQLVAAFLCFIAAPWADTAERSRNLRFTGSLLLSTFSASCLILSLAAIGFAWVTSVKARVGNALLFVGFHIKSLVYSSLACAISAALLKCVGLQRTPLNFGASIACTCLVLIQLLVQPVPLGGFWAVCVAAFLLFLGGSQQLLAALAEGALPKGFFAFVGFSHLWWLSPLIVATALASVLLLCHFLELLLATARGGYHIFCPPNPHLYSLDELARDAAQGKPLSLSPCKPRSPPSVEAFAQLFRDKLSPRLQGPAMAQQRRTVGGPVHTASQPAAAGPGATVTENKRNENPPQQKKASYEGAWLVALWLRGPFFLASIGALCIALSVGLYAVVSDSETTLHGARGPVVFDGVSKLLLPAQRLPIQQVGVSLVDVQEQKPPDGGATPLLQNFPQRQQQQQQKDMLFPADQHLRWKQRNPHLTRVIDAPTPPAESRPGDASRGTSMNGPNAKLTPGSSFLHLRRIDGQQEDKSHDQHCMKSAAALMLLALVLLAPLLASSLGEWIEDIFFAHMVVIKRNPWIIVPPPTLVAQPPTPVLEPAKAKEPASPSTNSSDLLLQMTQDRLTRKTPRNFLGLDARLQQQQHSEQQADQQA